MFKAGQKIGQYTLIKPLGRGGFGEVWLADWETKFAATKVAVKLPLDEQVDHSLIEHEAQLWAKASGHTNVLPIIEANEYDGQIVIVSEYAPDGSLEQLLGKNGGKLPVKQAVEMTIGILSGLEFLHSRNIIHRDLKPANVLLQGETPRLTDFGISRALLTTVASQTSNISGTFAYMSPEALDGKRSAQTDIWAAGANLYRFLTGKLPFPQKEPSALFPAIIMHDYEELPADIAQSLKTVIAKSLAKLPENRYQTAVEMREDLQKIHRGENVSASLQPKFDKSIPDSAIPPTEKVSLDFAQNFQSETETVVGTVLTFGENEKPTSPKVWFFATIGLFLVGAVGFSFYFLSDPSAQYNSNNDVGQSNVNNVLSNSSKKIALTNTNANSSEGSSDSKESDSIEPLSPQVPKWNSDLASLEGKQAQALVAFLNENGSYEFLAEKSFNRESLKWLREDKGAKFKPYYSKGDFNHDKILDFALILSREGSPKVQDGITAETHRYEYPLAVVIFNGKSDGTFEKGFKKDFESPLVCFLGKTFEKNKRLTWGVYETDSHMIFTPIENGYIVEYE